MPGNYVWMPTNIPPKCKLTKWQKQSLQREAAHFVSEFYNPGIKPPPDWTGTLQAGSRCK